MPLYHGTGGMVSIICLMGGITLCLGKKFSASQFWNEIRESNATCFTYVGETARYLLAATPGPHDKNHRVTTMFGNGLRPDVWTKFRDRFGVSTIVEFFGSSEGVFALRNKSQGKTTEYHGTFPISSIYLHHLLTMLTWLSRRLPGRVCRAPWFGETPNTAQHNCTGCSRCDKR